MTFLSKIDKERNRTEKNKIDGTVKKMIETHRRNVEEYNRKVERNMKNRNKHTE